MTDFELDTGRGTGVSVSSKPMWVTVTLSDGKRSVQVSLTPAEAKVFASAIEAAAERAGYPEGNGEPR